MGHFLSNTSSVALFLFTTILVTSQSLFGSTQQAHFHSNVSCIESERQALLQFRERLIDKSNRLSSWIKEDCCLWEGVGCEQRTGHVVKLDLRNPVPPNFDISDYCRTCLGGQINPSLVNLTNLQYLDLSLNNFSRNQIPTFLGLLKDLRYLNLSHAGFLGYIPHHIGNLSHLRYLDLGDVAPDSNIPDLLQNSLASGDLGWVTRLSSLEALLLVRVFIQDVQDGLRAINMLPSLTTLNLQGCGLDNFPHFSQVNFTSLSSLDLSDNLFHDDTLFSWLRNLTALQDLRLGLNNLPGPILDVFQKMTSLVHLDLVDNRINTLIPKSLCNLSSLTNLQLDHNYLQGSIPCEIGQLSKLANLGLSSNMLYGSIPKSLCNLSGLTYLQLDYNHLQGSIPSEIGQLSKLANLGLSSNMLHGTIPSSLWQLQKLQQLDISDNSLAGVLSEHHFAKLRELKRLDLSGNLLTLDVSFSWTPPFQLDFIGMQSIKIGPQFPAWLLTQKEVKVLFMGNASISDAMPSWFPVLCYDISSMDLSNNNITGNVPLHFKIMKKPHNDDDRIIQLNSNKLEGSVRSFSSDIWGLDLSQNFLTGHLPLPDVDKTVVVTYSLDLSDNHFTGSIPKELCMLKNLYQLDLSNNRLSGRVPLCLGNLRDLEILNLANNSLSGQIPWSLGNLKELVILHLNGNKFVGKLPPSMQNLVGLQILDLGDNTLKDTVPVWIGDRLSNLMVLRLQSNNFHGGIPYKLCQISYLQVLNLANNNLTGSIPQCFKNFTMMVSDGSGYILLSYTSGLQNFKGGRELMYPIRNVLQLKSISLSKNNLVGEIPDGIMNLIGLQILNLSQNHLSGRIPNKIGNLKQLETLDLSMNKLFGAIPPSLSGLDSLSSMNLSYNNLSGPIPSGRQLQTLTDPSIYEGNTGLCGKPLPNICSKDNSPMGNGPVLDDKGHGGSELSWFYAGIGPGFAVGLLGVLGILHFKKSWRYAYFKFLENAYDRIWVMIALKTSQLQNNFH